MEDEEIRRMLTEPPPLMQIVPVGSTPSAQQVDDLTRAIEALTAAVSMLAHRLEDE